MRRLFSSSGYMECLIRICLAITPTVVYQVDDSMLTSLYLCMCVASETLFTILTVSMPLLINYHISVVIHFLDL